MNKAAIYGRYSSDQQNDRSIEDQVALCRQLAEREGLTVVAVYEDRAISGASAARPGLQSMLRGAAAREFSVLICEGPSRLGRRLADTADIHDRLKYLGVQFLTVQHGRMSEMHIGILGTMAQMQLGELRAQTIRGQRGLVRDGRIPGGLCYGYEAIPGGRTGERRIVDAEAAIIRRIFRAYGAGQSANAIARTLNAERVPGPRGGLWNHTTICGHRERGTGILNNRLYVGEVVYGTMEFRRDPHTGKRVGRVREGGAVETVRIEALRIVDDELWDRVQARHAALDAQAAAAGNPLRGRQRASYPFSGLLFCGCCSQGYQIIGKDRYGCSARRMARCDNSKTVARQVIERRILAGLKDRLLTAEAIEGAVEEARKALADRRQETAAEESRLRRRSGELARAINRMIDLVIEGTPAAMIKDRMAEAEAERLRVDAQLARLTAEADTVPTIPHPRIAEAYRRRVETLERALGEASAEAQEALDLVRGLIERVTIVPDGSAPDGIWLEIEGDLAQLLSFSASGQAKAPRLGAMGAVQLSVDAGTGFEPVTFRL